MVLLAEQKQFLERVVTSDSKALNLFIFRQKKRWQDNVTEWTGLKLGEALRKAENREQWLPDHPWCPNGQLD